MVVRFTEYIRNIISHLDSETRSVHFGDYENQQCTYVLVMDTPRFVGIKIKEHTQSLQMEYFTGQNDEVVQRHFIKTCENCKKNSIKDMLLMPTFT
jgi:hypothetical protein